jgi:hypothetical protein
MATPADIEQFLTALKDKIKFFDIRFRPRDKNLQALADLEITAHQRLEYILKLTMEDYYAGPKTDTFNPNLPDYFEFGIRVKGVDVYIKISKGLENKPADCMSFHAAEFPMKYPHKKS